MRLDLARQRHRLVAIEGDLHAASLLGHFLQVKGPVKGQLAGPGIGQFRGPYNGRTRNQEGPMAKEMKEFAGLYYREGALDPKTTQLVALAAMAAAGCTS